MRKYSRADLGIGPNVGGPFSKYLNAHESTILIKLVRSVSPRVMIEFGCNEGITAARILENVTSIERYIGVDVPLDNRATLACQINETPVNPGWYAADNPRFHYLECPSQRLRTGHLEPCDAVFIDGDHSEAAVLHESRLVRRLIRAPGIIVWHDFTNPHVEVTDALAQLHDEGWPINCVEGSWLAFMRVDGEIPCR